MATRLINTTKILTRELHGTVFSFTQASGVEVAHLRSQSVKMAGMKSKYDSRVFKRALFRKHICGWDILEDEKGTPVPYSEEAKTEAADKLGEDDLNEIENWILGTEAQEAGGEAEDADPSTP